MSPIEINPTTRSPSTTGRWRNLPLVIISMMAATVSLSRQLTTLRVITSLTGASSTLAPRSPSTRTISRSDRMPSTPPLLITSTAPILRSPRILTAAESFASGSTLTMWWPLVSRIARTVIVVSFAPLSWRVLVSFRSSIDRRTSRWTTHVKRTDFTPACGLIVSRAEIRGLSRVLVPLLQLPLTAPREEVGREICRIAVPFFRRLRSFLDRIGVRLQRPPIQMPRGMTEHWQNDRETDEERQRPEHQQRRDNQSPCSNRYRIFQRNAQRRPDGVDRSRMSVQHQRKRDDTDTEGHDGEQEADPAANDDQRPSFGRRQHTLREIGDACSRRVAEDRNVDGICGSNPYPEQNEQQKAKFK